MRALPALLAAAPLLGQVAPPPLYPAVAYRTEVPRPEVGNAHTPYPAYMEALRKLAQAAPDRVRLTTLSVTEEGREQPFLVITSPSNHARLEALRAANLRLADPRTCAEAEAKSLAKAQPVFVWLGYSVHGSEPAGSEAALAVAHHFAGAEDPAVLAQLDGVVLLMDLLQNPDGRERHLQAIAEVTLGTNPSDPIDAQNTPRWPGGRYSHRLFDLNRDWAWQTQAESRARASAVLAWRPQVLVDHHEMMAEGTTFFPPNMAPVHEALAEGLPGRWPGIFAEGLAKAFDPTPWPYFSREVFDLFYPSYGDSWSSFTGAVGMTYEVGGGAGLSYRKRDGEILTLESRVRRHVLASLSTVATVAAHREALLLESYRARQRWTSKGEKAGAFLLAEGDDPGRARALVDLLRGNGLEVARTAEALGTAGLEAVTAGAPPANIPAGSYLVALDQPLAPMALALLQREARMKAKPSNDLTAWCAPLLYQVPAWFAPTRPRVRTVPLEAPALRTVPEGAWGYLIPAGQEGREAVLAALLQEGFRASVVSEPLTLRGRRYGAGSVVLSRARHDASRLRARLESLSARHDVAVVPLDSARVEEGPDLGSPKVLPLRAPRVAVVMDAPANPMAFGAVAHSLMQAGLAFTQLRAARLASADLRRYTHIVLVDDAGRWDEGGQGRGWQRTFGEVGVSRLKAWQQEGGVLVATEGGALFAQRAGLADAGFRFLAQGEEERRLKEKDPKREAPKPDPADLLQPWAARDDRALQEAVPGALLKVRVDLTHPLAWGLNGPHGAVLDTHDAILELSPDGEHPLHYPKEPLRLAGLLPAPLEAKLQQTAYLVRERHGQGAAILFAGNPVFRGHAPFTTRAFFNALFFGSYQALGEE